MVAMPEDGYLFCYMYHTVCKGGIVYKVADFGRAVVRKKLSLQDSLHLLVATIT